MDETELLREKRLKIGDEMMSAVRGCFPENSVIRSHIDFDSESYMANVSWKLCNDKKRPNKKSKIIRINITEEFMEEVDASFNNNKQKIFKDFEKYISIKIATFDPEHNAVIPPVEEWRYCSSEN